MNFKTTRKLKVFFSFTRDEKLYQKQKQKTIKTNWSFSPESKSLTKELKIKLTKEIL